MISARIISAFATTLVVVLLAAGCESAPRYADADLLFWRGEPEQLVAAYEESLEDPGRDGLVGRMKILSSWLLMDARERAEGLAGRVSTEVNVWLARQPGELDALSTFGEEREKPFKGEPHERAMADLYLGLLRYREGDFEGALACFRSALDQDRGTYLLPVRRSEARRGAANVRRYLYEADFAIAWVLAARSWLLFDEVDEAERCFANAVESRPDLEPLFRAALDLDNNVLVVLETGAAPRKVRAGRGGARLAYARVPGPEITSVRLAGEPIRVAEAVDLYEQATTLGGRQMDELNALKADRQEALQSVGITAAITGAVLAHSSRRSLRRAGFIGLAAGLATYLLAGAAIEPAADTRAWTTLPGGIWLGVARRKPGRTTLEVSWRQGLRSETARFEAIIEGTDDLIWERLLPLRPPWTRREPYSYW